MDWKTILSDSAKGKAMEWANTAIKWVGSTAIAAFVWVVYTIADFSIDTYKDFNKHIDSKMQAAISSANAYHDSDIEARAKVRDEQFKSLRREMRTMNENIMWVVRREGGTPKRLPALTPVEDTN